MKYSKHTKSKSTLASFLASDEARKPDAYHSCSICKRPELVADVAAFWEARDSGATDISFQRFYDRRVFIEYNPPPSYASVRKHTMRCMKRDITTGKKIGS